MPSILKFPDKFYWGTATSAYQVEGGIRNNWSVLGGKFDAGIACDHYHRFEEDFNLIKEMNNNAYRFSVEWARIEPVEGRFNQTEIEHYWKVLLALKKGGIEPFVTLYHWTMPIWFSEKGGWLNLGEKEYFGLFVERIVSEYKDLVKFWITINEPNVYTAHSFLRGGWPPFKKSFYIAQQAIRALIESHKRAYKIIHQIDKDARVGIANNNTDFQGILKFFSDDYWNHQFFRSIKDYQDFLGINYYFSSSVFDVVLRGGNRSDLNWKIVPRGIFRVLKSLRKYHKPIYITENGLADAKDEKREKFIKDHLEWIHSAIREGIDVRGYFYWSLMDNFEWDKGFEPRFGLVEIDYSNLKRIPRKSFYKYGEICKNNFIQI